MQSEINALKSENASLREQLNTVQSKQNDAEQYDRRWNVRVFNAAERQGETAADCGKRCAEIFTERLGVPTVETDIEAAHRVGTVDAAKKRPRPIIIRFHNRALRDKVLANRKRLKGQGISIAEDLTPANYKLERAAYRHSATMATWTVNGKIFAKLKTGKNIQIKYGENVDDVLSKAMQ